MSVRIGFYQVISRMDLTESLKEFRCLHQGAKAGTLGPPDLATYRAARDKLARQLLTAQHLALPPGKRQRRSLRVARALLLELEFQDGTVRATTLQLSSGGLAALLASAPQIGEVVKLSLGIPGGQPLQADARVVAVKEHLGNAMTSFQFLGLGEAEAERLEKFVFDAVLEYFGGV